ncbi:4167_t:CDS:1 [Diversispora eburnea]|uniref:4167_t:CDS:1 n=1 Tax=Diversispora eburnea TaxID=1213867 RepID=A0A9N8YI44_9GLOM|nr:4167_t:CDS:1 [Diversispora eburnea]
MSELPSLPPISELNLQDYNTFNSSINILFEPSPPLAIILYTFRPFESYTSLISTATKIIFENGSLTYKQKLEIINAHPRLGENKKKLSAMSLKEQGYSKTSSNELKEVNEKTSNVLDEVVNKKLRELNEVYEQKYGFKFVIFVNDRTREEIIPILEEKIKNGNKEDELNRGLEDMMKIAFDRLKKLNLEDIMNITFEEIK